MYLKLLSEKCGLFYSDLKVLIVWEKCEIMKKNVTPELAKESDFFEMS